MAEDLKLVSRSFREPTLTLRDLVSVLCRQRRLSAIVFGLIFLGVMVYGIVAPSYQSEMKVLLKRERVDPVVAPTPSQAEFQRVELTEEEVNSEAELLQDQEILRTVAQKMDLAARERSRLRDWIGDNDDKRMARAIRHL